MKFSSNHQQAITGKIFVNGLNWSWMTTATVSECLTKTIIKLRIDCLAQRHILSVQFHKNETDITVDREIMHHNENFYYLIKNVFTQY